MNQFTFWNTNEPSEHITLKFSPTGFILHLSRDKTRSTRPVWNVIGSHFDKFGTTRITFRKTVPHLWVAATRLADNGAKVSGSFIRDCETITSQKTNRCTDPETLMGRERKRSLNLGQTSKGENGAAKYGKRFTVDVRAMREAILARKK